MNLPSPLQLAARRCLRGSREYLLDPKYAHDPAKEETHLRERCRECWKEHGPHYPDWVKGYIDKWQREAGK